MGIDLIESNAETIGHRWKQAIRFGICASHDVEFGSGDADILEDGIELPMPIELGELASKSAAPHEIGREPLDRLDTSGYRAPPPRWLIGGCALRHGRHESTRRS
ncbi:MAG TPA: hypothetical protein VJR47_10050 [Stellaceae bacterium]|nr:hypothetical protein [Stellaceae bacterium]